MDGQAPARSMRRYRVVRLFPWLVARSFSRVRVDGAERLPGGPSVLCFTHENWADPFYVFAAARSCPRLYFFGPEQDEMRQGFRNRLMRWGGVVIPFRPGKRGLVAATARAETLLCDGAIVAIAGEGRIHAGEGTVLPLREGPAYLALRAGVPIVPMAINGTTWLGLRRVVRIRVGLPLEAQSLQGRPAADQVRRIFDGLLWHMIHVDNYCIAADRCRWGAESDTLELWPRSSSRTSCPIRRFVSRG